MVDVPLRPGQVVDERWRRDALALAPDERETLLARADKLREQGGDSSDAAYACYEVLHAQLDPERPKDAARLTWFLRRLRGVRPELEPTVRRAAHAPPGLPLWVEGQLRAAQFEREAGAVDEAIARLFAMLPILAGRRDRAEGLATVNLALLLLQQGRDLECIVLCRRAIGLFEACGEAGALLRSRQTLATQYARSSDWQRFDAVRAEIEASLAEMTPAERDPLERAHRILLAGAALEREQYDEGLEHLAQIEQEDPSLRTWVLALRAYMVTGLGRTEEGRALVGELRALDCPPRWLGLWVETTDAICTAALDDVDDAAPKLERCLDRLAHPSLGAVGNRTAMLTHFAESLRGREPFAPFAKRAYDLAAAGLVERIGEVARFARERPELMELNATERHALGDLRLRLHTRHRELFEAVLELLEDARQRGEAIPGDWYGEGRKLTLCAWCGCVRRQDGTWLPVGTFVPNDPRLWLSHGMCDDCFEDQRIRHQRS